MDGLQTTSGQSTKYCNKLGLAWARSPLAAQAKQSAQVPRSYIQSIASMSPHTLLCTTQEHTYSTSPRSTLAPLSQNLQ
ncbi:hypothetical protein BT67DRAFT_100131 [Trichocladium antarcticum]|uniref:Uncharacterized protein n=1 Tax=Trichocladium antarcticum TaxID=1450529 RepID=A0AAN6UQS1_9PEZI|nr:hypothetical protein BT67DRAFT_100131 [Trichocladium antarcticum]